MKPKATENGNLQFVPNELDGRFSIKLGSEELIGHTIEPSAIPAEDAQKILAGDMDTLSHHIKRISGSESGTYAAVGGVSLLMGEKEPYRWATTDDGLFRELAGVDNGPAV